MKKLLIVTSVLLGTLSSSAQTLEQLIRDLQTQGTSFSGLKAVFKKQPSYKDLTYSYMDYPKEFLGHNQVRAGFSFTLPNHTTLFVILKAIYKKEQVGYIRIDAELYDSIKKQNFWELVYRYVDTAYTNQTLAAYNNRHQSRFTWANLYEDSCRNFAVLPGNLVCIDYAYNSDGSIREDIFISREMKYEFYPLIKSRDHLAIVKNCLSFNPVRKAYGAICLYALQQLGEPLSKAEKRLLKKIRRSHEKFLYQQGCFVSFVKIRTLLLHKRMQRQFGPLKLRNPDYSIFTHSADD